MSSCQILQCSIVFKRMEMSIFPEATSSFAKKEVSRSCWRFWGGSVNVSFFVHRKGPQIVPKTPCGHAASDSQYRTHFPKNAVCKVWSLRQFCFVLCLQNWSRIQCSTTPWVANLINRILCCKAGGHACTLECSVCKNVGCPLQVTTFWEGWVLLVLDSPEI